MFGDAVVGFKNTVELEARRTIVSQGKRNMICRAEKILTTDGRESVQYLISERAAQRQAGMGIPGQTALSRRFVVSTKKSAWKGITTHRRRRSR